MKNKNHGYNYNTNNLVKKIIEEFNVDINKQDKNLSFAQAVHAMEKIFAGIDLNTLRLMRVEYRLLLSNKNNNGNENSTSKIALSISLFTLAANVAINSIPQTNAVDKLEFAVYILIASAIILFIIAIGDIVLLVRNIFADKKKKYIEFKLKSLELYLKEKVK